MPNTYRIGPGRILVADSISDPIEDWLDLGYTRGITIDLTPHEVARGRVDQLGPVAFAEAVWVAPRGFQVRASMADQDAVKAVKLLPGSILVTSSAKEALTFPAQIASLGTKAVAIIPETEYTAGDPWVDANNAVWMKEAFLSIDQVPVGGEVADDDDAIHRMELVITRCLPNAAGIGSPLVAAPEVYPQGCQFLWQPLLDGLVPLVRDSYTFTRASTATYTDADGVVQTAGINVPRYDGATGRPINEPQGTNLHTQSENDNSSWTAKDVTLTEYVAAPDGSITATRTVIDSQTETHYVIYDNAHSVVVSGTQYTHSLHVKIADGESLYLRVRGSGYSVSLDYKFLRSGNTLVTTESTPEKKGYKYIGDGWFRVWVSGIADGTGDSRSQVWFLNGTNTSVVGNGTDFFDVWGAQVEAHDGPPTSYIPTSGSTVTRSADVWGGAGTFTRASSATYVRNGVVKYAGTNEPRHQDSGLLLEPQRTNLQTYSGGESGWIPTRCSISANSAAGPDGTLTADKLVEDSSASINHFVSPVAFALTIGTTYSVSLFVKPAERSQIRIRVTGAGVIDSGVAFDLVALTTSIKYGSPYRQSIVEMAGGWFRCSFTTDAAMASGNASFYLYLENDALAYTGDGSSGLYFEGLQIEAGSSPTNYIPTAGSAVTRSSDSVDFAQANIPSPFVEFTAHAKLTLEKGVFDGNGSMVTSATGALTDEYRMMLRTSSEGNGRLEWTFDVENGTLKEYTHLADAVADVEQDTTFHVDGTDGSSYAADTIQESKAISGDPTGKDFADALRFQPASQAVGFSGFVVVKGTLTPAQIRKYLR